MDATELKRNLMQFIGTSKYFRYPLVRKGGEDLLYTEGVQFLAENGKCYWLLDSILLNSVLNPTLRDVPFQHWVLSVDLERRAGKLTCDDGNSNVLYTEEVHFTDFPLNEIRMYFTDNVLMLPTEY